MTELTRRVRRSPGLSAAALGIFLLLLLFVAYPLLSALKMSLTARGSWNLAVYGEVFRQKQNLRAIGHSLLLGASTASLATAAGFLFSYGVHRAAIPGRAFFRAMAVLPLISPPFMFALPVVLLFGRNGLITAGLLGLDTLGIYGFPGLLLVQTLGMFPLSFLTLSAVVQGIDSDLEVSAMNLGARRLRVFRTITLPLMLPGLTASWLLVFVGSLTDFGNPIIIGGDFNVLSVQAYLEFTGMGNLARGTALGLLLLLPSVGVFLFQRHALHKRRFVTLRGKVSPRGRGIVTARIRLLFFLPCLGLSLFVLAIYATIAAGSVVTLWGENWSFTPDHYLYSYDVGFRILLNTLLLALVSTPITAFLGLLIPFLSRRVKIPGSKGLEFLALLSYAIPGTVVGIGYVLAFNQSPFRLSGTAFILVAVYVFRNIPVGVEGGIAALSQISREIDESAANLGGDGAFVLRRITLPMIRPAFWAGATYAFVRSMTAVSAVIFLISARWSHLSVLILAQTEIMRLGVASVMAFALVVLTALILWGASLLLRRARGTPFPGAVRP